MSLFKRLDDVFFFMSTVDLLADSPQGGWGEHNLQRTYGDGWSNINFMSRPTGGVGGKETFPGGEGGGLEP